MKITGQLPDSQNQQKSKKTADSYKQVMLPVFFQAIGDGKSSLFLSLMRQIFCLIPLFWGFSLIGLNYTWLAFPLSETLTGAMGLVLYGRTLKNWKRREEVNSMEFENEMWS